MDTVILSADSRQFYREMSIGTAKPSDEELTAVPHYFINSHSIQQEFSVGDYEEGALKLLDQLFKEKKAVILTGGSGLYINAVTEGFDNLPKASAELRKRLNQQFQNEGIELLRDQLQKLDPAYYEEVDLNNPQRIVRALEVCIAAGKPFSSFRSRIKKERPFEIIKIGLIKERGELYGQINQRVDKMVEAGLVEEVRSLMPYRHLNALQTVGYSEIFDFLDGKTTLERAIALIKQNTRRYAKRQLTWFRKDPDIKWFQPDEIDSILDYIRLGINA